MNKVRYQTLQTKGLILEYNAPSVSKDEWLTFVRTGGCGSDTNEFVVVDTAERSKVARQILKRLRRSFNLSFLEPTMVKIYVAIWNRKNPEHSEFSALKDEKNLVNVCPAGLKVVKFAERFALSATSRPWPHAPVILPRIPGQSIPLLVDR
jgi:hypothetical protein